MSNHSWNDPLIELTRELRVTPSPTVQAEVRERIRTRQRTPRSFWMPVAVAVSVSLISVWVVRSFITHQPDPTVSRAASVAIAPQSPSAATREPAPQVPTQATAVPAVRNERPERVRVLVSSGNTLVENDQAVALHALLTGVRSGHSYTVRSTTLPLDKDGLLLAPEPVKLPVITLTALPSLVDDIAGEDQ